MSEYVCDSCGDPDAVETHGVRLCHDCIQVRFLKLHDVDFSRFRQFIDQMRLRLILGEQKYGPGTWRKRDLTREIGEELLDVVNYSFLEVCKLEEARDKRY